MILVIGGRSKIGSALIAELLDRGESVRALVRATETAGWLPGSAEAVMGDLADKESLRSALDGAERMFLLCGPSEQEVQLNRNAIDVAREVDIGLLVRSSILGADPRSAATFPRDHGHCDAYLAQSGLPYAIVRPNMFMQGIAENTIPSIDPSGHFYLNIGEARISLVDTRDVAAAAAVLLTEPGREGYAYDVSGPEALSYCQVAAKLSATLGRPTTYMEVADDVVRDSLLGLGLDRWMTDALVDLFRDYRRSGPDGYAAQVTDTVDRLTGRPPRTLDELLAVQAPTSAPRPTVLAEGVAR